MKSRLRSTLGSARNRLKIRLRTGTRVERAAYYTFFSDAFRREQRLVAHGHRRYRVDVDAGRHEFLLRRNIHMLEKGLTMRPRRTTFALDYIEETVELLSQLVRLQPPVLSPEVIQWARDVLSGYFDATAESSSDVIMRARTDFGILERRGLPTPGASSPFAPDTTPPPVSIADLTALATRRKSVRWFLDRPVERDAIDRAMLVALEAPSACNRQPFTFRFFDDPALVEAVARVPMGTAGYGHNLPAIAVIVGDLSAFIDERDRHLIYTDGCLAAMSFILGLESQGIASVCINWPDIAFRDKKMNALLGLSDHERVVMLIGFGHADIAGETPFSAKRDLSAIRSYNDAKAQTRGETQ